MKTVTIELPDEQAEALEHAAADGGFASSFELVRAAIEDLISAPVAYDPDVLALGIARHRTAKRRGDVGMTPGEARVWLNNARPHKRRTQAAHRR